MDWGQRCACLCVWLGRGEKTEGDRMARERQQLSCNYITDYGGSTLTLTRECLCALFTSQRLDIVTWRTVYADIDLR